MTTALPAAPPVPSSETAEAEFDAAFEAFLYWLANQLVPGFNAALPNIDAANTSAVAAVAAAAYKGPWASLAGALAIPASVSYNNVVWVLTESVANVAAEVPGVSTKWIAVSGAPVLELISSTTAVGVATVDFTNFDTLAATYMSLRLVACGLVGSAASADLNGQIRISNTWQSASAWQAMNPGALGNTSIGPTAGLKNSAGKALSIDMTVNALGLSHQPAVTFTTFGGFDSAGGLTYPTFGGSYFDTDNVPTTPIQGLRIAASTGNISGTFRLYGVRK